MARYFMGTGHGIGKKSGKPWYAVNILRYVSQFGGWAWTPCFCSEKFYGQVEDAVRNGKYIPGCPVVLTPDIDGSLIGMELDESSVPLDLVE